MVENQEKPVDLVPRQVRLSNGKDMPTVGLGTYSLKDAEKTPQLIYEAIVDGGYRFLDCATLYENEELVG